MFYQNQPTFFIGGLSNENKIVYRSLHIYLGWQSSQSWNTQTHGRTGDNDNLHKNIADHHGIVMSGMDWMKLANEMDVIGNYVFVNF